MKKLEIGQKVWAYSVGTYLQSTVLGFRKNFTGSQYIYEVYLQMPFGVTMYWNRKQVLTEEEYKNRTKPIIKGDPQGLWKI